MKLTKVTYNKDKFILPKPLKEKGFHTMKNIVYKYDIRPIMNGVFFESDGSLVASDGNILVVLKNYDKKGISNFINKVIDLKTLKPIDGTYPNYKSVIPDDYTDSINVEIDTLLGVVNYNMLQIKKNTPKTREQRRKSDYDTKGMFIYFDLLRIVFDCKKLFDVLQCLKANGAKTIEISYETKTDKILINSDNKNL